jgi:hypothetical protein
MALSTSIAPAGPLRTLFGVGVFSGLSDSDLLDRFAGGSDESAELAFGTIVDRHGPMVLRVCRGVLSDPNDTEDAWGTLVVAPEIAELLDQCHFELRKLRKRD